MATTQETAMTTSHRIKLEGLELLKAIQRRESGRVGFWFTTFGTLCVAWDGRNGTRYCASCWQGTTTVQRVRIY